MRTLRDTYRIVIGSDAWSQLGSLDRDDYVAVRAELVTVAEQAAARAASGEASEAERSVVERRIRGASFVCELNPSARTVTLLSVGRAVLATRSGSTS